MSDEEEYYEDDLDGEWLWFEDADIGVADELAEAATYSPVPVEDPSLDAVEVYSDWDYYSDDYYDDDRSILRRQRREKDVLPATENLGTEKDGVPPKKKQKFSAGTEDIAAVPVSTILPDHNMDQSTFKGVVWKSPGFTTAKASKLYEPGHGETVALLKNWRDVFKNPHFRTTTNWPRHSNQSKFRKASTDTDAFRVRKQRSSKAVTGQQLDDQFSDSETRYQILEGDERLDYQLEDPTGREFSPPPSTISEFGRPLQPSDHRTPAAKSSKPAPSRLQEVVVEDGDESLEDENLHASLQYKTEQLENVPEVSEDTRITPPAQEISHIAVSPPIEVVTPDSKKRKHEEPIAPEEDSAKKRATGGTRGRGRGKGRLRKDDRQEVSISPSSDVSPNAANDDKKRRAASPIPTRRSKRTRKSAK